MLNKHDWSGLIGVATVVLLLFGAPVRARKQVTATNSSPVMSWSVTSPRLDAMVVAHGRSISFPCGPSGTGRLAPCDPLQSNRMILNGTKAEWENYLICFNGEVDCAPVAAVWPKERE